MEDFKQRIEELRSQLAEHNRRYYVENSPSISDYDFDMLMNELIALEKAHPELVTEDSPTRRVGSDLADGEDAVSREFRHLPHRYPMLSLGNTYNTGEVAQFVTKASKGSEHPLSFCCELKFDGTAICLTYKAGKLVRALTRGDGIVGDDVLRNVHHIHSIPSVLHGEGIPDEFEIRGEIYMPYKSFDALCAEREEDGEAPFANPRNAASGSLKLTDSAEVGRRGLECTLYHMLGEDLPFATHDEALTKAASWGLPVSGHRQICRDIDEIEKFISYWDTERKLLPFATDGVVIKVNELPVQKELGFTSKFPRWAVAYKFKAEQACTEVLGIDYQVGRTGAVTPVANLTPVPLSGTMVKRATLHNAEQMEALDIRIGDWVYVEKGGEIIPKITAVELSKRPLLSEKPVFPEVCPDCGTPLVREADQAKWFCPNVWACPTQVKESLVHFLSRRAMNVLAGDATVAQLYDKGLVRNSADFYDLKYTDLYRLEGWKEKSCERFLKSLENSRKVTFDHVLYAIGIRNVGETTAKMLARHYRNIDALASASLEELQQVGDIGEIIAASIRSFFEEPRNVENIERLRKAGLQFSMAEEGALDAMLEGQTIVITGTYDISRDEMKALVESHSGRISSGVSAKTSFVLVGRNPGPEKIKKAGELGVRTVSEREFYDIIGQTMPETEEKELTLF
ncbi:MAG: NAD-dependent DNA ligase LigA [Bacteroidales bacterium]|nr:NAD-dependent DNA ligase LigA [Bacteroidales bacterium]